MHPAPAASDYVFWPAAPPLPGKNPQPVSRSPAPPGETANPGNCSDIVVPQLSDRSLCRSIPIVSFAPDILLAMRTTLADVPLHARSRRRRDAENAPYRLRSSRSTGRSAGPESLRRSPISHPLAFDICLTYALGSIE